MRRTRIRHPARPGTGTGAQYRPFTYALVDGRLIGGRWGRGSGHDGCAYQEGRSLRNDMLRSGGEVPRLRQRCWGDRSELQHQLDARGASLHGGNPWPRSVVRAWDHSPVDPLPSQIFDLDLSSPQVSFKPAGGAIQAPERFSRLAWGVGPDSDKHRVRGDRVMGSEWKWWVQRVQHCLVCVSDSRMLVWGWINDPRRLACLFSDGGPFIGATRCL